MNYISKNVNKLAIFLCKAFISVHNRNKKIHNDNKVTATYGTYCMNIFCNEFPTLPDESNSSNKYPVILAVRASEERLISIFCHVSLMNNIRSFTFRALYVIRVSLYHLYENNHRIIDECCACNKRLS